MTSGQDVTTDANLRRKRLLLTHTWIGYRRLIDSACASRPAFKFGTRFPNCHGGQTIDRKQQSEWYENKVRWTWHWLVGTLALVRNLKQRIGRITIYVLLRAFSWAYLQHTITSEFKLPSLVFIYLCKSRKSIWRYWKCQ